jgi:HD superfamily phosphohydrolase
LLFPIPELNALGHQLIRIPAEVDVPVTSRVLSVLDAPPLQRLRHISQLGLVSYVYPGAVHSRFEHSLGVYRLACLTLQHLLSTDSQFADSTSVEDLNTFLLAGLLHDVGHWPFCHAIEDLRLSEFPKHESLARQLICSSPLADVIASEWFIEPEAVANLIASTRTFQGQSSVLRNLLSGPVDIDKMDYLQRDSHHAGVPYGRNFDLARLVSSLCVGADGRSIAITEKGKTAAEMMVFARYVMFSEVYWHHTVRSATAMLQRLVFTLREPLAMSDWLTQTEAEFANSLLQLSAADAGAAQLGFALFGRERSLYKRAAQFTLSDSPEVFAAVARRPYAELVRLSELLAEQLSHSLARPLHPQDIIIDAPPVKLEVQFQVDVRRTSQYGLAQDYVPLSDVSPVVRALATEQFDSFVKRVRIFVAPQQSSQWELEPELVKSCLLDAAARL